MKKKFRPPIWILFTLLIFFLFLFTILIMIFIMYTLLHFGYIHSFQDTNINGRPILILIFVSILIGTFLSFAIGRKILRPISIFSAASTEIAKGNFDIQLNEKSQIKEIEELTKNFNIMTRALSNTETLQSDFILNVSHEFKTPLAAIEGYAMLLQDEQLNSAERYEYSQIIIAASQQLSLLTGNILQLSKLENSEIVLEKALFRLDEQIRQAILFLESKWSEKNIIFHLNLPSICYHGNQELLMQVWINLIENAIKFSHVNSSIQVTLIENEKKVSVLIKDTGIGMNNETKQRLYDKFYQADKTRKMTGNGLGLTLVKRIIQLSQGSILVESTENNGTCFTVSLPLDTVSE